MKARTRFIRSIIATSKEGLTPMPWQRGAVRAATVAARKGQEPHRKRA